jgi:hypothetical protein
MLHTHLSQLVVQKQYQLTLFDCHVTKNTLLTFASDSDAANRIKTFPFNFLLTICGVSKCRFAAEGKGGGRG